jgi:predicted MFS family arabinose efflux permease
VRLPDGLGVLRVREFRLIFAAQAVSFVGDRLVPIALAFAVLRLGGSPSEVGLVLACRTLPLVASLLIGGVVADRFSRRAVMVAADLSRVATQGLLALLLIEGGATVGLIAVLAGLSGAATGFFNPASTGLLPVVIDRDRLQQANGLRATAMAGGEIAGPVIGGVLIAAVGPGWALAVDAASFAVSAALLARLRLPPRAARAASSFVADLRGGWSTFRSIRWLWAFVASAAFGNLLWGAWSVLGPVIAERDLGGAAAWGAILAAMGVGALGGALLAIRVRPRRPLVLATVVVGFFVVPMGCLAAGAPAALTAFGALLAGGGMMLSNAVWESTLQREVPPASLSRVSAYDWFGSLAFQPLGMAIWGPVSALLGISASLWLAAAAMAASLLAVLAVPDVRALRGYRTEKPVTPSGSSSATSRRSTSA